jgi:quinolinate synthase
MDTLDVCTVPGPRQRSHALSEPHVLPPFTPELAAEMAPLYARVQHVVTPMEWPAYAPLIKAINDLKKKRNAVILAHNYRPTEIFNCVGDFRGDSLQLAKEASRG